MALLRRAAVAAVVACVLANAMLADAAKDHPKVVLFTKDQVPTNVLQAVPGRNDGLNGPTQGYFDPHNHITGVVDFHCAALAWTTAPPGCDEACKLEMKTKQVQIPQDLMAASQKQWEPFRTIVQALPEGLPDWGSLDLYLCEWMTFGTIRGYDPDMLDRFEKNKATSHETRLYGPVIAKAKQIKPLLGFFRHLRHQVNRFVQFFITKHMALPKAKHMYMEDGPRVQYGAQTMGPLYKCIMTTDSTKKKQLEHVLRTAFAAGPSIDFDASYVAADPFTKDVAHHKLYSMYTLQTLIAGRIKYGHLFQPWTKIPLEPALAKKWLAQMPGVKGKIKLDESGGPVLEGENVVCKENEVDCGKVQAAFKGRYAISTGYHKFLVNMEGMPAWAKSEAGQSVWLEFLPHSGSHEFAQRPDGVTRAIQKQGPLEKAPLTTHEGLPHDVVPCGRPGASCFDENMFDALWTTDVLKADYIRGIDFATAEISMMNKDSTPDTTKWNSGVELIKQAIGGKAAARKWMYVLYKRAVDFGKKLVMHVHCGEGFPVFDKTKTFPEGYNPDADHFGMTTDGLNKFCAGRRNPFETIYADGNAVPLYEDFRMGHYSSNRPRHYAYAQHNIITLATAIGEVRKEPDFPADFDNFVEIRFGHITHAIPEGAAAMKAANVHGDVNMFSNLATRALRWEQAEGTTNAQNKHNTYLTRQEQYSDKPRPKSERVYVRNGIVNINKFHEQDADFQAYAIVDHGFIPAIAGGVSICPGSDGRGVEWSAHRHEVMTLDNLIKSFNRPDSPKAFTELKKWLKISKLPVSGIDEVMANCHKTMVTPMFKAPVKHPRLRQLRRRRAQRGLKPIDE